MAELEDEGLQRSLAEIYAHAAADVSLFKDKEGEEPIRHLRAFLRSPRPKVRARACVALAKARRLSSATSLLRRRGLTAASPSAV